MDEQRRRAAIDTVMMHLWTRGVYKDGHDMLPPRHQSPFRELMDELIQRKTEVLARLQNGEPMLTLIEPCTDPELADIRDVTKNGVITNTWTDLDNAAISFWMRHRRTPDERMPGSPDVYIQRYGVTTTARINLGLIQACIINVPMVVMLVEPGASRKLVREDYDCLHHWFAARRPYPIHVVYLSQLDRPWGHWWPKLNALLERRQCLVQKNPNVWWPLGSMKPVDARIDLKR